MRLGVDLIFYLDVFLKVDIDLVEFRVIDFGDHGIGVDVGLSGSPRLPVFFYNLLEVEETDFVDGVECAAL